MTTRTGPQRRHTRYQVLTTADCRITFDDKSTSVDIVNVSKTGICITTSRRIPESEEILVSIADRQLRAKRVWHIPESIEPLRYRIGLEGIDDSDDFMAAAKEVSWSALPETR